MLRQLAVVAITGLIIGTSACKDTDHAINEASNAKMRETLKKEYPSLQVSQIRIEVKNFQDVSILLGDKQLFEKTDEELKEITHNIALLTYELYHENNYLDEGKITYAPVESRLLNDEDPRREFNMHLQEVIESQEKK